MTERALPALLILLAAAPLHADFDAIARVVASKRGVRQVPLPMIGLARFCVWIVHPKGVHDFQIATFESGGVALDAGEMGALIRSEAGAGFLPLVQVRSNRAGEWSYIYARPHGADRVELLVFTHDRTDTVLVRVDVDADAIAREMAEPRRVAQIARR